MRLRLQISRKRYENLSKEEKEKIHVMVMNDIKSFLNMKNEGFLGIEKIITKQGKKLFNEKLVLKVLD